MIIRRVTRDDLMAIASIQATSSEAAGWDPDSYLAYDCLVAVVAGVVKGFLVSRQTGPGEREILNLAVEPSERRKGIARRLLEEVLAVHQGVWFLEVRESNTAALNLYKRFGFQPAGRREDYYRAPPETAIVMSFFSCYCHGAQSAIGDRLP